VRLGGPSVLTDQSADGLPALDPGRDIDGVAGFTERGSLLKRLMGPVAVVVSAVLVQDSAQVLLAGDQQVVQALSAQCPDEPLGEGIGPG
jgi:hypothetical protein